MNKFGKAKKWVGSAARTKIGYPIAFGLGALSLYGAQLLMEGDLVNEDLINARVIYLEQNRKDILEISTVEVAQSAVVEKTWHKTFKLLGKEIIIPQSKETLILSADGEVKVGIKSFEIFHDDEGNVKIYCSKPEILSTELENPFFDENEQMFGDVEANKITLATKELKQKIKKAVSGNPINFENAASNLNKFFQAFFAGAKSVEVVFVDNPKEMTEEPDNERKH